MTLTTLLVVVLAGGVGAAIGYLGARATLPVAPSKYVRIDLPARAIRSRGAANETAWLEAP